MKKIILSLAIVMSGYCSYAQFITNSPNTTTSDKVGIGTTSPRTQLSIVSGTDNNGTFFPATNAVIVGADNALTSLSSNLAISSNSTAGIDIGGSIGLGGRWLDPGDARDLEFAIIKGAKENSIAGNGSGYLAFGTYGIGGMIEKMRISSSGNVLIGQTTQANAAYKLDVKGSARADKIVVNTTGADFVFDKKYALPKLSDVKAYINDNHHLPEIPSAKEMQTNGVELGQLNTKLLQKVEELTLYLIDKDKQLTEQQKQIDDLKKQRVNSDEQETRIAALEKALSKQANNQSK